MNGLDAYADVLTRLRAGRPGGKLPFLDALPGIESLYQTMVAVAPARPGAPDEEWNPLSQRPHTPLPPAITTELGAEVTVLKEAVDAFTTLCHEMLHVALWEPFFAGKWRPKTREEFLEFALRGEGYCFFFSDIVLTSAVRVKLPDGEFALERQTPSSAVFAPVRAFSAMGIKDHAKILDVYLDAFNGEQTKLWQAKGKNDFAAALAARTYDFYAQSVAYLGDFHAGLQAFGVFTAFFDRFCAVPGLPTFPCPVPTVDARAYFKVFFGKGMKSLAALSPVLAELIRWRRMLQMRAYYVMQVRWLVADGLTFGKAPVPRKVVDAADAYLDGIEMLLRGGGPADSRKLAALDSRYDTHVRGPLRRGDVWVGERFMILPRRAGGKISVFAKPSPGRAGKAARLVTVAYLVDELTRQMKTSRTVEERTEILAEIERVAGLAKTSGTIAGVLKRPWVRETWSLPLASVDPAGNAFRELAFSYQ